MTLYTIMPMEVVMSGLESMDAACMDITVNGVDLEVQPINATQATIVRLRSGNPQDYLNPNYSPGKIIEFRPVG
ncbi:YlzJ-like protein [Paenibacillus sp. 1_12]|uniref:YlzJ-like family protein n=1 Tax=Paenibacillus sp. 1_12 TaxID=1566278 RepID=UPI0008E896B8|nr:YlzJ-like family protein [Paenibacillus sp. 1_12]SFL45058.1 YlzJ-like protein [Paenibacillus sp. 1_12]